MIILKIYIINTKRKRKVREGRREREKKAKGIEINLLLWEMKNCMDVNRAGGIYACGICRLFIINARVQIIVDKVSINIIFSERAISWNFALASTSARLKWTRERFVRVNSRDDATWRDGTQRKNADHFVAMARSAFRDQIQADVSK